MRRPLWIMALLAITACTNALGQPSGEEPVRNPEEPPPAQPVEEISGPVELPNLGAAPELYNDVWLNTDAPLRLAELRGKVVLLDMWTFG